MQPSDWLGAEYLSSNNNGSLNTYRTEINLPSLPTRARLYITALGYGKTYLNGALTDDHELGMFVTFQQKTLYDVVDVKNQLVVGCNALVRCGSIYTAASLASSAKRDTALPSQSCCFLPMQGVMLGNGWWSQDSIKAGDRQFRALLSLRLADGSSVNYASAVSAGAGAMTFVSTAGACCVARFVE